jgi:hypothetical protein
MRSQDVGHEANRTRAALPGFRVGGGGWSPARPCGARRTDPDPVKSKRVMEAMLKMKKIEIEDLKRAYEGR